MCGRSEWTHMMTKTAADTTRPIAYHALTPSLGCTKIVITLGDTSVFRGNSLLSWTVRTVIKLPWEFEDGVFEVPSDGMAKPDNAKSNDRWIRHAIRCMLPHWAVDNSLLIWTRSVRADLYHPAVRQQHRNIRDVIFSSSRTVNCIFALNLEKKRKIFFRTCYHTAVYDSTQSRPSIVLASDIRRQHFSVIGDRDLKCI